MSHRQSATGLCQYNQWMMDSWVIDSRNSQFIIILNQVGTWMEEFPQSIYRKDLKFNPLLDHMIVWTSTCSMIAIIHFKLQTPHIWGEFLPPVHIQNIPSHSTPLLLLLGEVSSAGGIVVHGGHHPRHEANYQNITSEERNVVFGQNILVWIGGESQ